MGGIGFNKLPWVYSRAGGRRRTFFFQRRRRERKLMTMTADFSGKALAYTGTPTLVSFSPPALRRGEALIRLLYAGICNTDLEILQGYMGFTGIMGHEFVGVVTECGDADWVGRRVTGEINIPCGRCAMCRQGLGNHCPNRQVMGIQDRDGCFAPFFTLPLANLHRIPDSVPDRRAVFSEPLAAAFQPFNQHDFSRAAACLVLGDGKLGILQALAASHMFADCRTRALMWFSRPPAGRKGLPARCLCLSPGACWCLKPPQRRPAGSMRRPLW